MRHEFILARNTYNTELVKKFREDFMEEISSELRSLIKF